MSLRSLSCQLLSLLVLSGCLVATPCRATMLQISVVNNQPAGGFVVTPFWFGVHDGTFTTFTPGTSTTGTAIQQVAELGSPAPLLASFAGHGSQTSLQSNGAIPPFQAGETASSLLDVQNPTTNRYLSFAAMLVPSNDWFLGNANPTGIQLFDASGNFGGTRTIQIFGRNIWDAGTEVNDITFGSAFIAGVNIADHTAENGVAHLVDLAGADATYLNSILGRQTPVGYNITHLISANDLIATITISAVAVPEPSTFVLMGIGGASLLIATLKRRFQSTPV